MIKIIFSALFITLQLYLIVKWSGRFLNDRRKRKLFTETSDFHRKYYEKLISNIIEVDPNNGFKKGGEVLENYSELYKLYLGGCTLQELKDACVSLKSEYANYIPEVKKELRDKNIDELLED